MLHLILESKLHIAQNLTRTMIGYSGKGVYSSHPRRSRSAGRTGGVGRAYLRLNWCLSAQRYQLPPACGRDSVADGRYPARRTMRCVRA
jgi:hypothetical protein